VVSFRGTLRYSFPYPCADAVPCRLIKLTRLAQLISSAPAAPAARQSINLQLYTFACGRRKLVKLTPKSSIMKKVAILVATFLFAFTTFQVDAQEKEKQTVKETKKELRGEKKALRKARRSQVSDMSKQQFVTDFGKIPNAHWSRATYYDRVVFTKDGQTITAFYDDDSKLIATSVFKKFADLPARGQSKIKSTYKDYAVGSVCYIDYRGSEYGVMYYGRSLETDNYFVELINGAKKILVMVDLNGGVSFFKQL
jgi:Ni/Co efflux regulator RcnB